MEALGVAVYTTDAAGRITYFNDAAARLWGRRPDLGEEWCGSWRLFWSDGRPMAHAECPMAIALRENRSVRGETAIAERPDGTRVFFEPYPTPLRDASGTLVGAVNVLVDVSSRQQAQDDLRTTADALLASSAVQDDFLGLVSHELRTPVTTIFGNAQILGDRGDRVSTELRGEMVADIAEDAERLFAIIENLLLFSRMQAGTVTDPEPQVLPHVIRQEVGAFQRRHPDRVVSLVAAPDGHLVVEADRTHLVLLIQNLLSNAHKYSGPTAEIEVHIDGTETEAEVRVLDRGLGIDGVDPDSLFAPFYRAKEAQRVASGLGLGLPVCERIVAGLGGRIWARSRQGGGSEFGFALPIAEESYPTS